ncbi:hypothetical protein K440DRAFT_677322 [Wilcoxina mikolae CBS 423.85]|nr:hypothetical protein K440DRAFT_677322 [Wilcoxina mikolae CBS 423.85]
MVNVGAMYAISTVELENASESLEVEGVKVIRIAAIIEVEEVVRVPEVIRGTGVMGDGKDKGSEEGRAREVVRAMGAAGVVRIVDGAAGVVGDVRVVIFSEVMGAMGTVMEAKVREAKGVVEVNVVRAGKLRKT